MASMGLTFITACLMYAWLDWDGVGPSIAVGVLNFIAGPPHD